MLLFTFIMFLLFVLFLGLFLALGTIVLKLLYIFCIGIPFALCFAVLGALLCLTVIGIPLGKLLFRAAGFVLSPLN